MRFIAEWCLNAANRLNERTAFLPRLLQHCGSSSFDGSRLERQWRLRCTAFGVAMKTPLDEERL